MRTVTVQVTSADIDRSDPVTSDTRCPVARAVSREIGMRQVSVIETDIWIISADVRANLPPEATKFIRDFDNGVPVSPFSFDIELPEEVLR